MQFFITYDAANSTVSTFPANSYLRITFSHKQKLLTNGDNMSIDTTNTEAPKFNVSQRHRLQVIGRS
jgi:hypothetical protein